MLKTYEKPMIYIESFSLCSSIAAECEYKANFTQGSCAYIDELDPEHPIFTTSVSACITTDDVSADGSYEGICYHTPTESNNLFNS